MDVKQLTMAEYHPQKNGHTERYNRMIVSNLRHYVVKNHSDWDEYVQRSAYYYNFLVHSSTKVSLYELKVADMPQGLVKVLEPTQNPVTPETT